MSKALTVVVVVIGAAVAGDRVLGTLSRARGSVPPDVSADMKQLAKGGKAGKELDARELQPTSEIGKDVKAIFVKSQKRDAELAEELKHCDLEEILDWERVSTPEGRKDALKRIGTQLEVYRSYFADTCRLRKEIAQLMRRHRQGEVAALDTDTAEEGKLHRHRAELFGKYIQYIEAVGKSELITQNGEVFFVKESDRKKCEVLFAEATRESEAFGRHQAQLLQVRQERQDAAKERLGSLN